MRIALCTISPLRYPKEATTITTLALARALREKGHEVAILARRVKGLPEKEFLGGLEVYRLTPLLFLSRLLSPAYAINRLQKAAGKKFDLIHTFSATPLFLLNGWCAKLLAGEAKWVHSFKSYPRDKFSHFFYFLANLADAVTVPTNIFLDRIRESCPEKIQVVPSFIDTKKFFPRNKTRLKEKHGYAGKKIIFYYGSLAPWKGPQVLLEAMPEILAKEPQAFFLFAPRYKEIDDFRRKAQDLGLNHLVSFLTEDVAIEELVALADVVALPYLSMKGTEGIPSCLLESMACKTPVVTTSLTELKEVVVPGKEVLMALPGDPSTLAKQINLLLGNADLSKKLAGNAFEISQRYDAEKVAEKFVELYGSLGK